MYNLSKQYKRLVHITQKLVVKGNFKSIFCGGYAAAYRFTANYLLLRPASTTMVPLMAYSLSNLSLEPREVTGYINKSPIIFCVKHLDQITFRKDEEVKYLDVNTMKIVEESPEFIGTPLIIPSWLSLLPSDSSFYNLYVDNKDSGYQVLDNNVYPYYLVHSPDVGIVSLLEVKGDKSLVEHFLESPMDLPSSTSFFPPFFSFGRHHQSSLLYMDKGRLVKLKRFEGYARLAVEWESKHRCAVLVIFNDRVEAYILNLRE
jgi:hypothetical protein